MVQDTPFILPHELNFSTSFGSTSSRAREELRETRRKAKAGAIGKRDFGKEGKQIILKV
jgi:hypothetical protein